MLFGMRFNGSAVGFVLGTGSALDWASNPVEDMFSDMSAEGKASGLGVTNLVQQVHQRVCRNSAGTAYKIQTVLEERAF